MTTKPKMQANLATEPPSVPIDKLQKETANAPPARNHEKSYQTFAMQITSPAYSRGQTIKKRRGKGPSLVSDGKKQRRQIPWPKIKNDFRTGMTNPAIAYKYGGCVTHQGISKRAIKEGWTKDLITEVAERTAIKLLVDAVDREVDDPNADAEVAIDQAAEQNVAVIVSHRKDIRAGRQLANLLFSQLQMAVQASEELSETIEIETSNDINTKRRDAMRRAISLPQHAATLRDLTMAMKNLIGLEREAHNLDSAITGETIEDRLKSIERGFI